MTRLKLAAALVAALLLSGCSTRPEGTDGDLGNEWPAMAEPVSWTPKAGVCQDDFDLHLDNFRYTPSDCGKAHLYEYVHIGEVKGVVSGLAADVPEADSVTYRNAWSECDKRITDYLGGPWRERKVAIGVSFPTWSGWGGGARWYVCQVSIMSPHNRKPMYISGSIKGKFGDASLQYGCYQVTTSGNAITDTTETPCTSPHNAEFVGVTEWAVAYSVVEAEAAKDRGKHYSICAKTVEAFVGARVNTGTWTLTPNETDWSAGDYWLRCYLYTGTTSLHRSMKGVGAKGWLR